MKKIGMLLLLSILLVACGQASENGNSNNNQNEVKTDDENAGEEIANTEVEKEDEENEPVVEETLTITKGETLVIEDYAEITVNDNVFGKRIDPPNPGSFYSYYEIKEEGEIYLDTIVTVKSLLTSSKSSDEFINVKVMYDDKYEYRTFSTLEDKGGADFTYTNITSIEPLKTGVLHYIASLPEEVENDGKPLKIIISAKNLDYELVIR
ncbi:hypothetical protein A0U40_18295 [[Bacillus] sp. KCTC 13219]|nr:hypothetical protein A0U40_18295 [[Bacillus] sp. KCTC 13219]